jgi:hypothetical protein
MNRETGFCIASALVVPVCRSVEDPRGARHWGASFVPQTSHQGRARLRSAAWPRVISLPDSSCRPAAAPYSVSIKQCGIVRLTYRDQRNPKQDVRSHCRHRIPPFARRFGSEDPQRRSRDEMALKVEGVVDGGMHAEEALSGSSRFEALHLALSSPHRLMRILGAIILP